MACVIHGLYTSWVKEAMQAYQYTKYKTCIKPDKTKQQQKKRHVFLEDQAKTKCFKNKYT